ncbi:MAG: hypothetical protein CME16_07265 [Gemmatimonadetes bacterium]|nr:hypothetical protein [Gemmatimonadota bacterium]
MVEMKKKMARGVCWNAHQNEEKVSQFERDICAGQDWDDLSAVLGGVEVAYREGRISRSKAEDLATWAKARGKALPEQDVAKAVRVIPGEDLSSPVGENCPCCGEDAWWGKAGRAVCAICHPHPGIPGEGRVAA